MSKVSSLQHKIQYTIQYRTLLRRSFILFSFLWHCFGNPGCIVYTDSKSQFRLAGFQVLISHVGVAVAGADGVAQGSARLSREPLSPAPGSK